MILKLKKLFKKTHQKQTLDLDENLPDIEGSEEDSEDSICMHATLTKKERLKTKWNDFVYRFLNGHSFILLDLFKWLFVDLFRLFRHGRKLHLYGIEMYCGLYGQGKTIALTERLDRYRMRYKDKIYIATNYFYKDQDFAINSWKDLLKEYDRPIVFGYDEIQNEFNSRDFSNFPTSLLSLLTQNRKGHGKMILCTAQRYNRVDKVFRELCSHITECKTHFGRLTLTRTFDHDDYNNLISVSSVGLKMKIHPIKSHAFVQTDRLRDLYDSYQMLESAKSKEYISRQEQTLQQLIVN